MIATPNLIQGELHAIDKKRIPASHRYSKQFYPPKFIKSLERHLIKRYTKLKIDVVEDEDYYLVYFIPKVIISSQRADSDPYKEEVKT